MYRKLSAPEISAVIAKIRNKYEEYCNKFFKTSRVREQFENRYLFALRSGVDISNFLLAEISAIEELIKKEEKKIEGQPAPAVNGKKPVEKDFADKIIEANGKKILKYPPVLIHKDANPEIKHLLGALNVLYEQYFPNLHSIFRTANLNINARDLTAIENNLRQLAYLGNDRVPSHLTRYYTLINRFPRDYRMLEREEKDYILESSFLLHDLYGHLLVIQKQNSLPDNEVKKEFGKIVNYIYDLILDFRLKDLKRRK